MSDRVSRMGGPERMRRVAARKQRILITPEGIAIPITLASRGARFGALVVDFIVIIVLVVLIRIAILYIADGVGSAIKRAGLVGPGASAFQFLVILWVLSTFALFNGYFLFFELGPRGATPGKRITGIRIAARDGGRLTAEMVIARNLLRNIELFLPLAFLLGAGVESAPAWLAATGWFLIFMLFPVFNRDRLRAGDVIAGTWVLERPKRKLEAVLSAANATAGPPRSRGDEDAFGAPPREYRFTDGELAVYGEYELQALERVLREGRTQAIEAVYRTISEKIGRNDGWSDESRFLECYYTQLRARLEAGMRMGRRKADKHAGEGR